MATAAQKVDYVTEKVTTDKIVRRDTWTLTLSSAEVSAVKAVLSRVSGDQGKSYRKHTDAVLDAINGAGGPTVALMHPAAYFLSGNVHFRNGYDYDL